MDQKDSKDAGHKNEESVGSKAHRARVPKAESCAMGPSPFRGRSCPQADTQENGDEDKNYPQEGMDRKHRGSDLQ
jgi:hypothetical protein